MQIFVPYRNMLQSIDVLWHDRRRFYRQITELKLIINTIEGKNHWEKSPIVKMYKDHLFWLKLYQQGFIVFKRFVTANDHVMSAIHFRLLTEIYDFADLIRPDFLTIEFCNHHKSRLYAKNPKVFEAYEIYGTSDENWYVIDGKLLKYKNGKLLKN